MVTHSHASQICFVTNNTTLCVYNYQLYYNVHFLHVVESIYHMYMYWDSAVSI